MPDEKRTTLKNNVYEFSSYALHSRLHPMQSPLRTAKPAQPGREALSPAQQEKELPPIGGFVISRDLILHLIDWFKEE
jgi:hypothetical protein